MTEFSSRHAPVMKKIIDATGGSRTKHYVPSLDEEPEVEDLLQMNYIASGLTESGYHSLQSGRAAYVRYLRSKTEAES